MVRLSLALAVCLGAMLCLQTANACCGCCGHSCGGRPCGFSFGGGLPRPPCGGGRPCGFGLSFGGGRPPCGGPPCGGPPSCSGHVCPLHSFFSSLFHRPGGVPAAPAAPVKLPAVNGNLGLFSWKTSYNVRNERFLIFTYNGQVKRFAFPSDTTLESLLIRFKNAINYKPPTFKLPAVNGHLGMFSWKTSYNVRNERFLIFSYMGQVRRFAFPSGSTAEALLIRFKSAINYSAPKPETGSSGPVTWETNWNNNQGTITFYFRQIVNGKLVIVGQKTYPLRNGSPSEINGFLSNFQSSSVVTNYKAPSPPTNGNYYRYETNFANGQRTITFYYKLYVNGEAVSTITKEYTLQTGSSAEINSFYQKFNAYCAANSHYTPAPKVTGKLTWKTSWAGNDHYVTMFYKEYKDDVLVDTKSKKYALTSGSDAEIKEKLADFKIQLKNGNV